MDRKINISHLPEGQGIDRSILTNIIEKFYDKLSKRLPGEMLLDVHFKEFRKHGSKELVETKVKVNVEGINLYATGEEWNAEMSLKEALAATEKEAGRLIDKKKSL